MRNSLTTRRSSSPQSLWDVMSEMERAFDSAFTGPNTSTPALNFDPKVDVEETKDYYLLSFDLPGLDKDKVNIEVNDGTLTVSGQRERSRKSEDKGWQRFEREFGQFRRQFQLPRGTQGESVEARFENGVLEVLVPKAEETKAKKVKISDNKGGLFSRLVGGKAEDSGDAH